MDVERGRIFRLLETADNFVKYAAPGQEERAAERARQRYEDALELARRQGDAELVEQVRLRLGDLSRRTAQPSVAAAGVTSAQEDDDRSRDASDSFTSPGHDDPATADPMSPGAIGGGLETDDLASSSRLSPTSPTGDEVLVSPRPPGERRVPPGQRVTSGWPVLHEGRIPRFDKESWRLRLHGACSLPYELTYDELLAFPIVELRSDFHCVTGWSKLDNLWRGVQTKVLLRRAEPATDASHVLVHGEQGYTANLPIEVLMDEDALVTWSHNSRDLAPKHGFPLRLLVPRLYGWKSVKWLRSLELMTQDRRGFWETRGYHNHADPWREERYAYQEG
ncbi:MAG TPA: sulfite oxidase-like oxidoreductase [Actinomycetota bacterium]|nr:sulfite oxidase-like oxidoreductase [Actinomycetota bacterium]